MKAIGIDVGGTKTEGVLVNEKFKVLKSIRIVTPKNKKRFFEKIVAAINELKGEEKKIKLCIGIPGAVNEGRLVFAPHLKKLVGTNVKKELEKRLKQKIAVDNEVNFFAVGEHKIGAGKGTRNLVAITIGTGIGGGIIINNKPYRGQGWAGEMGHTIIQDGKDFEHWFSGTAIKRTGKIDYEKLGIGLANIIISFNPDMVVIGGGVSNSLNFRTVRKKTGKYLPKGIKFRIAKGKTSPAVGAAIAAMSLF